MTGASAMKKMMILLLTAVLLLCGCQQTEPHTHAPDSFWDRDAQQHWHGCSCGEKIEAAAHTMDEEGLCTVCGCVVGVGEDVVAVINYDEQGNPVRRTLFAATGESLDERYTYTTDENGTYRSGIVATGHHNDGSHRREEDLDCYGNQLAVRSFDEAGNLLWKTEMEYVQSGEGYFRCVKSTGYNAEDGITTVTTFDADDRIDTIQRWDASGNLVENRRYEREFDHEGNMLWMKEYDGDRLTRETVFAYWESGAMKIFHVHTSTAYHADGTKTVTEYNKYEEIVGTTTYDAAGNPIT